MTSDTIQAVGTVLGAILPFCAKLVVGQHTAKRRHVRIEHKLDLIMEEQSSAKDERRMQKNLTNDILLRIAHLEEKYAGLTVGSTIVPEATPERQEMKQKAEKITGRFPIPPKPKKS